MRYEIDENNYILNVYFGCHSGTCTEYTGEIPEGYETLAVWAENANVRAYKLVEGNLVLDVIRNEELEALYAKEAEENSYVSKKYVGDRLEYSTAVVTDELATETNGNDLIIIEDAGNYEIPKLKIISDKTSMVEVVSSNKNLLGINGIETTVNGVSIYINSDGTITLNGEATGYIEYNLNALIHSNTNTEMLFLIKNNIDYVISGLTNGVSLSLYSYDGTDRTLIGNYSNEAINLSSSYKITQATLNIESGTKFEYVDIAPQIEIGNVATEFIRHEETKATGILENNECIIDSLVSYLDKTIIMLDHYVECNVTYYRYKYINEKLVEIQVQEDAIKSTVSEINETVNGQNQKISEVTQMVGELNSKITEIADITTSKESINGTVEFEGINQSEPIYIKIHPIKENISYVYPSTNSFPCEILYLKTRFLRFTNTSTQEIIDYTLPTDLLYYDAENYDELILDYEMQSCMVNKRVAYNADGTVYVLETPTTIEFEYPRILLTDGDYTIELVNYDNAYLFVRLMAQNIYTTQFATKAEMHSTITQTVEEIDLSVDKKLEGYSTTEEMNSAINVKADSITSSVSRTYATKSELSSEIKQTADSISLEVEKKVGDNEIISKINQSAETVGISANKIELSANDVLNLLAGNEINLTSQNIVIKSEVLEIDKYGNIHVNDGDGNEIEMYPSNFNMVWNYVGNTMGAYLQKSGLYIESSNGNYIDINANAGYIEICTNGNKKRITGNG